MLKYTLAMQIQYERCECFTLNKYNKFVLYLILFSVKPFCLKDNMRWNSRFSQELHSISLFAWCHTSLQQYSKAIDSLRLHHTKQVFRLKVAKGFEKKARLLQRIGMSLVKHKCIIFFVLESLKCFQMSRGYISPLCRLMYENSMLHAMVEVKHCRSMAALKKSEFGYCVN